jgi:hypothetical protein
MEFVIEVTDQYNQTDIQTHSYHSTVSSINQLKSFTYYTFVVYAINELGASPKSQPVKIQTLESGKFYSLIKTDLLFFCALVPLAMIRDLRASLLNSSTTYISWTFEQDDLQLLNGKFRTFAVIIYENFSKNT